MRAFDEGKGGRAGFAPVATEVLTELGLDEFRLHVASQARRPGVIEMHTQVEHEWFPPNTPRNAELDVLAVKLDDRFDVLVLSVPIVYEAAVTYIAEQHGLTLERDRMLYIPPVTVVDGTALMPDGPCKLKWLGVEFPDGPDDWLPMQGSTCRIAVNAKLTIDDRAGQLKRVEEIRERCECGDEPRR